MKVSWFWLFLIVGQLAYFLEDIQHRRFGAAAFVLFSAMLSFWNWRSALAEENA